MRRLWRIMWHCIALEGIPSKCNGSGSRGESNRLSLVGGLCLSAKSLRDKSNKALFVLCSEINLLISICVMIWFQRRLSIRFPHLSQHGAIASAVIYSCRLMWFLCLPREGILFMGLPPENFWNVRKSSNIFLEINTLLKLFQNLIKAWVPLIYQFTQ